MSQEEFLTVNELAYQLKVAASWVYDQVRLKPDPLPHYKMGKYLRFLWSEVSAWIERRHHGGEASCQGARRAITLAAQKTAGRVTAGKDEKL
jgi:predicted DNA-binding transcriptional regulator AlpA